MSDASKRWNGWEFVARRPYYMDPSCGVLERLVPLPLHYVLFSQWRIYRFLIGGAWFNHGGIWTRMEDWRPEEFCNDHCEMQPCEYCARMEDDYGRF